MSDAEGRSESAGGGASPLTPEERYHKALRAADYQTGGPEDPAPAGVPLAPLAHAATAYGRYDRDGHRRAVKAAVENGDLLAWRDRDGDFRITPTDEESLRDLVAAENAREDTSVDLVERARDLIRGEGGERA